MIYNIIWMNVVIALKRNSVKESIFDNFLNKMFNTALYLDKNIGNQTHKLKRELAILSIFIKQHLKKVIIVEDILLIEKVPKTKS